LAGVPCQDRPSEPHPGLIAAGADGHPSHVGRSTPGDPTQPLSPDMPPPVPSQPEPGSFPFPFHGFYLIALVGRRAAGSSMVISGGTARRCCRSVAAHTVPGGSARAEAWTDWGRQSASSRIA
jgi:hypothetical protein